MAKRFLALLILASVLVPTMGAAQGWRAVRTGTRNFEKAWKVYLTKQDDRATAHFERAAEGFADALAEDPPPRTARLASNLVMAGISFYMSGRYEECVKAMEMAGRKNKRMWEVSLFSGLAQARLDHREEALAAFDHYLQAMPSQRFLSKAVSGNVEELAKKSVSLAEAADGVETAAQRQFIYNFSTNYSPRTLSPAMEQCGGPYWWRRNDAPCSGGDFFN